jgi:orotate phosphoribosyltransferase
VSMTSHVLAAGDIHPQEARVLERFRRYGALLEGHFRLSSGLHSPVYFQSALLLQHPAEAELLGRELASRLAAVIAKAGNPELAPLVVAPALGGIVIGHELARALGGRAIFAEREDGRMALRRGFRIGAGEQAIVCEDVVTTGGSAREVVELVWASGGSILAVAALVYRGAEEPPSNPPLLALARLRAEAYSPDSCPQCASGLPLVKPGSRGTKGSSAK